MAMKVVIVMAVVIMMTTSDNRHILGSAGPGFGCFCLVVFWIYAVARLVRIRLPARSRTHYNNVCTGMIYGPFQEYRD